jgi:hypothetical protein
LAAAGLAVAAPAAAQTQQALLPGPTPYPTDSPPLFSANAPAPAFLPYNVHIRSAERVLVGIDEHGRPVRVVVRQRLLLSGKGDYQLSIGGPVADVRAAPGSQSEPGLRADQLLWAGFSPGRKVLAADVIVRARPAARYLPVSVRVRRDPGGATLTVTNATQTPEIEYTGKVRAPQMGALLDQTRRTALAGERLRPTYATFEGLVGVRKQPAQIEAPLKIEGSLELPGGPPVSFSRILGDGRPLGFRVHARGEGAPKVRLRVTPASVTRLLRPPGEPTWAEAARRGGLSPGSLLQRLIESRMRLVRSDQYQSFLANPDPNGSGRTAYVYETVAAPAPTVSPHQNGGGGGDALLVTLVVVGTVVLAGGAVVLWAHS